MKPIITTSAIGLVISLVILLGIMGVNAVEPNKIELDLDTKPDWVKVEIK